MDIGTKIKIYRKKNKLTQSKLASITGISYSQIQKVEAGVRTPNSEQLQLFADAFGMDINKLVNSKAGKSESDIVQFFDFIDRMEVSFNGSRDDKGRFIPETLTLKINGPDYMSRLLSDYADYRESVDFLRKQAPLMPDDVARDLLEHRAKEIHSNYSRNIHDSISRHFSESMMSRMNAYLKKRTNPAKEITVLDLLDNDYSFEITSFDRYFNPETIRFDISELCSLDEADLLPFFELAYACGVNSEEKSNEFFQYDEEEYPYVCLHFSHDAPSSFTDEEYRKLQLAYDTAVFHSTGGFGPEDGREYITRGKTVAACFDSINEKVVSLLIDTNPYKYDEFLWEIECEFGKDISDCVELITWENYTKYSEYVDRLVESRNLTALKVEVADRMYCNMCNRNKPGFPAQASNKGNRTTAYLKEMISKYEGQNSNE